MMKKERQERPEENQIDLSQEVVEQLMQARTMEKYLAIAAENGIDWDSMDDEWLEAIVSGDISDLLWRQQRRLRKSGRRQHENGI